jgi:muramidase (phage lysozyme)
MIPLIMVVAIAAFFFVNSNASATATDAGEAAGTATDATGATVQAYIDPPLNASPAGGGDPSNPQIAAFLALIRQSEGTSGYADPWSTFYGGVAIPDLSTHPCELRSDGSRLIAPVAQGDHYVTAAGAYQINLLTWNAFGGTTHYGSFNRAAQDQCAADIIAANSAAASLIAQGAITQAQGELSNRWSSFTALTLASNNAAFTAAGGSLVS